MEDDGTKASVAITPATRISRNWLELLSSNFIIYVYTKDVCLKYASKKIQMLSESWEIQVMQAPVFRMQLLLERKRARSTKALWMWHDDERWGKSSSFSHQETGQDVTSVGVINCWKFRKRKCVLCDLVTYTVYYHYSNGLAFQCKIDRKDFSVWSYEWYRSTVRKEEALVWCSMYVVLLLQIWFKLQTIIALWWCVLLYSCVILRSTCTVFTTLAIIT
jgi:hypothetical protein